MKQRMTLRRGVRLSQVLLAALAIFPGAKSINAQDGGPPDVIPAEYVAQIPPDVLAQLQARANASGGRAALLTSAIFGLNTLGGRTIGSGDGPPGNAGAGKLTDVPIANTPFEEDEPMVAANPKNKKFLVAGSHKIGVFPGQGFRVRCAAYASSDGGASWSAGVLLQQIRGQCSDPVLAYAPDGSRAYFAYIDVFSQLTFPGGRPTITERFDILVSHSDDNGATWSAPVVALAGQELIIEFNPFQIVQPGFDYDKPWINTHVDAGESNWVYVTATRFNNFTPGLSPIAIHFTRSDNRGESFAAPATLENASGNVVIQGSHPAGGVGGDVLVAWYNSGTDGFLMGSFEIHTRRSSNHGTTFDPVVVATTDSFELPFFLGPLGFYERWWGGMFPSLAIDAGGGAHIVYTHDPVNPQTPAGFASAESGDIRYISSGGPPYTVWAAPITVNDDGLERAQGYPAINTQHDSTVDVVWYDHRLSPSLPNSTPSQCFVQGICNSSNLHYDVFYARKVPGQPGFFDNFRVSDTSSLVQFDFIGDYIGLAANETDLFAVWTDRRNRTSIFQTDNDVFGSRIIAGGATPK
jgi:hypothetical protein